MLKLNVFKLTAQTPDQANICLLEVNNRNTRRGYEICSKLAIKTLGQRQ